MTVNVAMIGLGWWGQKMVSVLKSAEREINICRAVEPNLEAVNEFVQANGLLTTKHYADALQDANVDAVILATPHATHEEQIELAVQAGKHVFCEKPLALTKAGAQKAVKLCADAGLVLGMGHERRFEPAIDSLLKLADSGEMGRVQQIEANFSHDKLLALPKDNWRLSAEHAPAAGMTATGIHLLDLSVRLLGQAESVLCHCETLCSELPQGDTISAYVKFKNGGTSYISASLANPFHSRFAVFGSKGWIDIRDKAHVEAPEGWVVTKGMADCAITVEEVPTSEAVKDNLVAFAQAVKGERTYPITAEHLVNNIALLEAVFKSARDGKPHRVD